MEDFFEPDLLDDVERDHRRLFDPTERFDDGSSRVKMDDTDPLRRLEAWTVSQPIRRLACHPKVLELLRFLHRREPIPFQTLNFLVGTEQSAHSDAFHFSSLPAGFMCGVWIALEDVTEDNGPLVYYPGSHHLPELRVDQLGRWAELRTSAAGPNYDR